MTMFDLLQHHKARYSTWMNGGVKQHERNQIYGSWERDDIDHQRS